VTHFNIEFLVADFGSKDKPQMGIIGAKYNYQLGDLNYECRNVMDCATDTQLQAFTIRSSVSFNKIEGQASYLFVPPPPSLIPPLPSDLFYPFTI
jgi:tectonic-1/3